MTAGLQKELIRRMLLPVPIIKNEGNDKGFALLEILLSFGVSAIIITGMVYLGVITVRAGSTAKSYAEAGKIAQREVTRLKIFKETKTWVEFIDTYANGGVTGCSVSSPCHVVLGSPVSISQTVGTSGTAPFDITYSFSVNQVSSSEMNYTVLASWNVGDVAKDYIIEGRFTNWRGM